MSTEYVNAESLMLELLREGSSVGFFCLFVFLIEAGYLYPAVCLQHALGLPV